jgi:phage portal protein BeeE
LTETRNGRGTGLPEFKELGNGESWRTSREDWEDTDPFKPSNAQGYEERSIFTSTSEVSGGNSISALIQSLGGDRKITRPYLQNLWVYACVSKIAQAFSSVRVRLFDEARDGERTEDVDSPMAQLFKRPNPLMSQRRFLEYVALYDQLWGETYLLLLKKERIEPDGDRPPRVIARPVQAFGGGGFGAEIEMPDEIWPIAGHLVDEMVDRKVSSLPFAYRVREGTGHRDYPAHAVAQVSNSNPHSLLRGVGPMTPAIREAAKGYQIDRYDEALLRNGGVPSILFTFPDAVSLEEQRAVRKVWRETSQRPDEHKAAAVLPHGVKAEIPGFKPNEMEFGEFREWTRESIMAAFGVTKPLLGITDDVNRANAQEAHRVFWETKMAPMVSRVEDELDTHFISRVREPRRTQATRVFKLDTSGIKAMREDTDAVIDRTIKLHREGRRSFVEAADLSGWDIGDSASELDGGEERWIENTVRTPDQALADPIAPDAPEPEEDEEEAVDAALAEIEERMAGLIESGDPRGELLRTEDADEDDEREKRLASIWKQHDEFLQGEEARFAKKVERTFERYALTVRKRLRDIAKNNALSDHAPSGVVKLIVTESELDRFLAINLEEWQDALADSTGPAYSLTLTNAAKRLHEEVNGGGALFKPTDPRALDFLRNKELLMKEGPMTTFVQHIQRNIVRVLAQAPPSATTLAKAIAESIKELEDQMQTMLGRVGERSMLIARTEITSANSFARVEQMKLDGIEKHTWLTSRDDLVRDEPEANHKALEGATAVIDEVFVDNNGSAAHNLRWPGDNQSTVANVANCRCSTIPEIPRDN